MNTETTVGAAGKSAGRMKPATNLFITVTAISVLLLALVNHRSAGQASTDGNRSELIASMENTHAPFPTSDLALTWPVPDETPLIDTILSQGASSALRKKWFALRPPTGAVFYNARTDMRAR